MDMIVLLALTLAIVALLVVVAGLWMMGEHLKAAQRSMHDELTAMQHRLTDLSYVQPILEQLITEVRELQARSGGGDVYSTVYSTDPNPLRFDTSTATSTVSHLEPLDVSSTDPPTST